MVSKVKLGDITVDVVLKDIKNVHLSVHPPTGRVRISAPARMSQDTIRAYAISKLGWIKKQQGKFQEQQRESPREYLERESHYLWGRRYLLNMIEVNSKSGVDLQHNKMVLKLRPGTNHKAREEIIAQWYRDQVRIIANELIKKWEPIIGVKVNRLFIQKMKTKWGSCNTINAAIRLNTELGKKNQNCLEYIVVHEMVHLKERHHNHKFTELMDMYMWNWRQFRQHLNSEPLGHVSWEY